MRARALRSFFAALLVAASLGCATSTAIGSPPNHQALASLSRGASSEDDVRRALGEPFGRGEMRTGRVNERRKVWSYEYTVSHMNGAIAMSILIVFLHEGRYDGHLWFSADTLLEAEPQ